MIAQATLPLAPTTGPRRFQLTPTYTDAWQFRVEPDGTPAPDTDALLAWCGGVLVIGPDGPRIVLRDAFVGGGVAHPGDWITLAGRDSFMPWSDVSFRSSYHEVTE